MKFTYIVVIMPLNSKGEGPETDSSLVTKTVFQIWNLDNDTVCECGKIEDANLICHLLNKNLN